MADCTLLAQETHKFESRYLDGLIGPYPETKDLYIQRSPIHSVDKFKAPIIFFQVGLRWALGRPQESGSHAGEGSSRV